MGLTGCKDIGDTSTIDAYLVGDWYRFDTLNLAGRILFRPAQFTLTGTMKSPIAVPGGLLLARWKGLPSDPPIVKHLRDGFFSVPLFH
ncbi:MAG TPA: hypothetical protein VNL69_07230 [Bacteroidota bacterium]|nr:hypothetical protein [Bacteroidota bacterium]